MQLKAMMEGMAPMGGQEEAMERRTAMPSFQHCTAALAAEARQGTPAPAGEGAAEQVAALSR